MEINKEQYLSRFKKQKNKIDFEFQELGLELEPFYGKVIWSLFHKVGMTEQKIRDAHKIAEKRGVTKFPYLLGIIKNLK